MKKRRIILLPIFFILFTFPIKTNAQSNTDTGKIKKFNKGLIVKKNRKRIHGTRLLFRADSLTFNNNKTSEVVTIPLSKVQYVRVHAGSHAMEGALIGGGIFFLSALLAYLDVESDPNTEVTNAGQVIGITTAIGFGGGLLIGAMFPKEKTIYKRGKFVVNTKIPGNNNNVNYRKNIPLAALNVYF